MLGGKAGVVPLLARVRFEQRFRQGLPGTGLRTRLMGRAALPFADTGTGLVVWDELFVDVNEHGGRPPGFGANRLFLGAYLDGRGRDRFEVGGLLVSVDTADGPAVHHLVAVNLFLSRG